jgi:hypothetical protein
MALPFYRSFSGTLFHRVRSGRLHKCGDDHHISIHFWCGNGGFLNSRQTKSRRFGGGELFAETPEKAMHCALCEGKAIGAGCDGTRMINGRHVLFSPRV